MAKYRKKPETADAVQWHGEWTEEMKALVGSAPAWIGTFSVLRIKGLYALMTANPGDWVVRGPAGEFCSIKADIFAATYDPVEAPD